MSARAAGACVAGLACLVAAVPAPAEQPEATSCTICHTDPAWFGDDAEALAASFKDDVHAGVGLSCHDCHGGNPDPGLADDVAAAMDPDYAENPFRGVPARTAIPGFCGRCHSDPIFMRRFRPDARVDQEEEYYTSAHGRALADGDTAVATCIDCHHAHGILPVDDSRSPVHATHVAETCARCHADAERMAGRTTDDGRPLPVDQYAQWRLSVHAAGLLEHGDLSSPTCNDCHGNHGARPPGVEDLSFVCGQCHGREATLFRDSPKEAGFHEHNGYLEAVEGAGCAACHTPPEPQAERSEVRRFTQCATCHGNHLVVRPTVASLSPLPETPCEFCHGDVETGAAWAQEPAEIREHYERTRAALLEASAGLEPERRFDWLVDRLMRLPPHRRPDSGNVEGKAALRPTFARLLERFRIGRIDVTLHEPDGSEAGEHRVVRCGDCHAPDGEGLATGRAIVTGMQELTTLGARAERILAAARRGGVEVQGALMDIDRAVDSQIELEVLVHAFHAGAGSAFHAKQAEGIGHARSGLEAGHAALRELAARRRGLGVSLVLVALVLVALAIRIRRGSRDGSPGAGS